MENLGLDTKLLIAQATNFILFFVLFKRFLAKPFGKFIESEKAQEMQKQKLLESVKKQEEELEAKMVKLKEDIKRESKKVIAEAKEQADKLKAQIIAEAHDEAAQIREKAAKQIEEERKKIAAQAQEKVVELSFFLVNKALSDSLDEKSKKQITANILKSLSGKKLIS